MAAETVFGDVTVDLAGHEIHRAGEAVPVEPQVFEVLAYLIEHRDRLVPKTELLDEVWGDRFVSESALTSRIKAARRAVGDNGRDQRVIRTVHGRGYRFVAPVDEDGAGAALPAGSGLDAVVAAVLAGRGVVAVVAGPPGRARADALDEVHDEARAAGLAVGRGSAAGLSPLGAVVEALDEVVRAAAGCARRGPHGLSGRVRAARDRQRADDPGPGAGRRAGDRPGGRNPGPGAGPPRPRPRRPPDPGAGRPGGPAVAAAPDRAGHRPAIARPPRGRARPRGEGGRDHAVDRPVPARAARRGGGHVDPGGGGRGELRRPRLPGGEPARAGGRRPCPRRGTRRRGRRAARGRVHLRRRRPCRPARLRPGAPPSCRDRAGDRHRLGASSMAIRSASPSTGWRRATPRRPCPTCWRSSGASRRSTATWRSSPASTPSSTRRRARRAWSSWPTRVGPWSPRGTRPPPRPSALRWCSAGPAWETLLRAGLAQSSILAGDLPGAEDAHRRPRARRRAFRRGHPPRPRDGGLLRRATWRRPRPPPSAARALALAPGAPDRLLDVITLQGMIAHSRGEWFDRLRRELMATRQNPAAGGHGLRLAPVRRRVPPVRPHPVRRGRPARPRPGARPSAPEPAGPWPSPSCVAGEAALLAGRARRGPPRPRARRSRSTAARRRTPARATPCNGWPRWTSPRVTGRRPSAARRGVAAGPVVTAGPSPRSSGSTAPSSPRPPIATRRWPSSTRPSRRGRPGRPCEYCQVMLTVPTAIACAEAGPSRRRARSSWTGPGLRLAVARNGVDRRGRRGRGLIARVEGRPTRPTPSSTRLRCCSTGPVSRSTPPAAGRPSRTEARSRGPAATDRARRRCSGGQDDGEAGQRGTRPLPVSR